MFRNIRLDIRRNKENADIILIVLTDIAKDNISRIMKEYNLKDFSDYEVSLYNKILEDFDAEYDDDLADIIEEIVAQIKG